MRDELSHLDEKGRARMVEVGEKPETAREAVARGRVEMQPGTLRRILEGGLPKGDVLGTARVAGVMAAKRCAGLIPMCHPLRLTGVEVRFWPDKGERALEIEAVVRAMDRTGVEMEALTAVSVAGLTVYDMCKAVDRGMAVTAVRLAKKTGGRSGTYVRPGEGIGPPGTD
ncbi:MAG: cyclic pyranopterin monophosphate synthase MoaC [Candidatus Tectomicrobia bacterium]|nr:cyclic pyranopterin monophosphate synthase MoaC [Candidatus Tectomicrobia bacterium]